MIFSKYNFLFQSPKYGYLLYNSITNLFAEIDKETVKKLENIKQGHSSILDCFSTDKITTLKNNKIFVENDYDEYLEIKLQKHLKRFDRSKMNITIAPTLHCNFNCDYCFEEARPNIYMNDEIEYKIIEFIKRHDTVKTLYVTWYGGEPLLNFKRIKSLTQKIQKLNLNYFAAIITNGYLLDKRKIDEFINMNIKYIHITLDGPKHIHDIRRPHIKKGGSFDTIYNNILQLKPYLKDRKMKLSIRVNVDKTNEVYYHEIYQKIKEDFEGIDVSVYSGIVKKTYGSCSSIDDILLDSHEQANFNIEQYQKFGIKSPDFFPMKHNGECIARQIYGYLIDPLGDIYKCWTDTGKKTERVGNISNNELINTTKLTRYLTGADVFDNQECQECFFLPVCGGGCPHLAIKKMFENKQIDLCHIAKGNLEQFLEIYYEIKNNSICKNYY